MISEKTYTTHKTASELMNVFGNLQNFAKAHPLIVSISSEEKNGYFKVKEKPFLIPISIYYSVKPLLTKNKVTFMVKGLPLLKPTLHYHFKELIDYSELTFTIQIKGFIGANQYLAYKMTKAMDELIENINSEIVN